MKIVLTRKSENQSVEDDFEKKIFFETCCVGKDYKQAFFQLSDISEYIKNKPNIEQNCNSSF